MHKYFTINQMEMVKPYLIQVRVTRQDYEQIRSNGLARGFETVSDFVRSLTLERDLWIEKKTQETYLLVSKIHQMMKQRK